MKKILVIGAVGQIGSELTMALRKLHGSENVIASNIKVTDCEKIINSGPFRNTRHTRQGFHRFHHQKI